MNLLLRCKMNLCGLAVLSWGDQAKSLVLIIIAGDLTGHDVVRFGRPTDARTAAWDVTSCLL